MVALLLFKDRGEVFEVRRSRYLSQFSYNDLYAVVIVLGQVTQQSH